ncbi:hypothetical protein ACVIWU_004960 [Bradyrhizobium sp. USDA 4509]
MTWAISHEDGEDRALAIACLVVLSITMLALALMFISGAGHPGIDFSCFWAAGSMALKGHGATAYDWDQLRQMLIQMQPADHA